MLIAISESASRAETQYITLSGECGSLFPPPALGERCDRGLARRLVTVARRARYTAGGGGGFGGLGGGGFGGFGGSRSRPKPTSAAEDLAQGMTERSITPPGHSGQPFRERSLTWC